MRNTIIYLLLVSMITFSYSDAQNKNKPKISKQYSSTVKDSIAATSKPIVTFIELGSIRCIPCKAMQPIMKSVEEKYGNQLRVVFYDVWQQEQAHYAQDYKIRLIPTQVFLDANGKELMRHEGFFPKKDIDTFLQSKGLKPKFVEKG